ncbi:putative ubiquitin-specific processing protease 21 [Chytriomyces sp. MP71]|nr:putative ubiquitin-specific processing protease 21 [Chytriomyces sp. MP71]
MEIETAAVGTPANDPMDAEPQFKLSEITTMLPSLPDLQVEAEIVHRWDIDDWKELKSLKRTYSPEFEFNGTKWRILVFPQGNNSDSLAVFLDSIDAATHPKDSDWHLCVQFAIAAANPDDESVFRHNAATHRYNPHELDWGFNQLCKLNLLYQAGEGLAKPLLHDDNKLQIIIYARIIKDETGVLWHNFNNYDSKKTTGFVGLKNQGATCYMNSLLQSLYFVNYFRTAVFNIPTTNDEPTKSIPLALQRIFYQLQFSDTSVGTTELTKSFGWDTLDSFMQHDVQEFNRVLQDNLESKMKGTRAEGAISKLFVGKYKSYIKCINVEYESSRVEDFYDIQLNVKGFKSLRESFVDYIAVETMDGDNKYQAEGHGLQDAKKGVIFTEFPPVLHLQLKRFEYDFEKDAMVKINDRYEFPSEIDLSEFLDEESAVQKGPQKYLLHGVLVHAGDVNGGHYCAFLRAEKNGKWFKFDDDKVIPVMERDAMEENFGVDPGNIKMKMMKRFTNAYMLVYVRDSNADEILKPITSEDMPEHLMRRFEEERIVNEQKRRDREEQHLYFNVKYITDHDVAQHTGFDLCSIDDKTMTVSPVRTLRIKKDETLSAFKKAVAEQFSLPSPDLVKVYSLVTRQNKTLRVDMEIAHDEKTLEQIKDGLKLGEFKFYVDLTGLQQPLSGGDHCLIFVKKYDNLTGKIGYAGKAYFPKSQKIADAIPEMQAMAKLEGPVKIFEEVKPGMIEPTDITKTFSSAELGNGDIICIQNDLTPAQVEALEDSRFESVVFYFEDFQNRMPVIFKHKNKDKETQLPDVELVLSKKMTYDQVVSKLGPVVNWEPTKIQLYNSSGNTFKAQVPIKRNATMKLAEMTSFGHYVPNAGPTTLFYELLSIDLTVLETKKFVTVIPVDCHQHELEPLEILVPKTARALDVLAELQSRVTFSEGGSGQLRLFDTIYFKIHKVYDPSDSIAAAADPLYVEEIPIDELNVKEDDKVVNAAHFTKDASRGHGVPFKFVVIKGELFAETKLRLIKRLGIQEKDVAKTKFFHVRQYGNMTLLEDGHDLSSLEFTEKDYIGVDHVDRSGKSSKLGGEKSIKIFN